MLWRFSILEISCMLPYFGRLSISFLGWYILIPLIECLIIIITFLLVLFLFPFLWNMLGLSLKWPWLQCPLIFCIDLGNILHNLIPSTVQIQKLADFILFLFLLVITLERVYFVRKLLLLWNILWFTCIIYKTFSCTALSSLFSGFTWGLFRTISFLSFYQQILIYLGLFLFIQYWSSCLNRLIMQ